MDRGQPWPTWSAALLAHELARHQLAWDIADEAGGTALTAEGVLVVLALSGPRSEAADWIDTLERLPPRWQHRFGYAEPASETLSQQAVEDAVRQVAVAVISDFGLTLRVSLVFAGQRDPGAHRAAPLRWAS